jgi:hypothetical protein
MRQSKPARPPGQNWKTFLKNHGHEIWSCDYLPITDIFFRQHYAYVMVLSETRPVSRIKLEQLKKPYLNYAAKNSCLISANRSLKKASLPLPSPSFLKNARQSELPLLSMARYKYFRRMISPAYVKTQTGSEDKETLSQAPN